MKNLLCLAITVCVTTHNNATPVQQDKIETNQDTVSQSAAVGQQVLIGCGTGRTSSVALLFRPNSDSSILKSVFDGRNTTDDYKERLRIIANPITNSFAFILENAQPTDSGMYGCIDGWRESSITNLTVFEYISVTVGETLTLPCYTTTADVEWRYRSSEKALLHYIYTGGTYWNGYSEGRFNVSETDDHNFALVIFNVIFSDSGIYTCVEDSVASHSRHEIIVRRNAHVHDNITLPCKSVSVGADVDWWYYPSFDSRDHNYVYSNRVLYNGHKNRSFVGNGSSNDFSLTINNVQLNDTGIYICVEDTGYGDQHFMELVITVAYNTSESPNENQNNNIIFVCISIGVLFGVLFIGTLVSVIYRYGKKKKVPTATLR